MRSVTFAANQGRSIGGNTHQPKKSPSTFVGARVDEGWWGGPSWSPASCSPGSHLGGTGSHPHRRATLKAHPTPHPPPSPLRSLTSQLRLMPIRADQSAVCAINRPLLLDYFVNVHH